MKPTKENVEQYLKFFTHAKSKISGLQLFKCIEQLSDHRGPYMDLLFYINLHPDSNMFLDIMAFSELEQILNLSPHWKVTSSGLTEDGGQIVGIISIQY